ncbi:MAG: hypothetical protein ACRD1U_02925, partial [Vicinamibacterales bacterium]
NKPDDLAAVNTSSPGCSLFTGACGVGAEALSVSPEGPASLEPGCVTLGDTGDSEPWEHAIAPARIKADAHVITFVYCIRNNLVDLWNC